MNTLTKTPLAGHRTIHMSVDIAGVLRWSDKELVNMFTDEDGNRRPAAYVRDWLKLQLAQGKRVLPMAVRAGPKGEAAAQEMVEAV